MFGNPMEIAVLVGAAVLLFGADKIPKLARGVGQAKKEFMVGQAEADVEAERLRAEARLSAERRGSDITPPSTFGGPGDAVAPSAPVADHVTVAPHAATPPPTHH